MKIDLDRVEVKAELRLGLVGIDAREQRFSLDSWLVGGIATLRKDSVLLGPPALLRLELRRLLSETLKQTEKDMSEEKLAAATEAIFRELANEGTVTIKPQFSAREVRRRLEYVRKFAQHTSISSGEALSVAGSWGTPITNVQIAPHEVYGYCLFDTAMEPQGVALIGPVGKNGPPTWLVSIMRDDPQTVHGVCLVCDAVFAREMPILSHRAWDIPEHESLDKTIRCPGVGLGPT